MTPNGKIGVLLLGDSIRQGYQKQVKNFLGDEYEVFGPEDNCKFAKYTLNFLRDYLTEYTMYVDSLQKEQNENDEEVYEAPSNENDLIAGTKPDIIHWNCGLWDTAIVCKEDGIFTPVDEYVKYCSMILRELRKITPHVIFATTTPVKPGSLNQIEEYIIGHNAAIKEFMEKENVIVNDLYSVIEQDKDKYIREDCIHLNKDGQILCGKVISDCIRNIKI